MSQTPAGLDRRTLLVNGTASLALWRALPAFAAADSVAADPMAALRGRHLPTLVTLAGMQLLALAPGRSLDDPGAVAQDLIDYLGHVGPEYQQSISGALSLINIFSLGQTRRRFHRLSLERRRILLNQGETVGHPVTIAWDEEYLVHLAVTSIATLLRMIIFARDPAQHLVGPIWNSGCNDPRNLVRISEPAYPDLDLEYDLCVVGSGAGGSVVAARAAERGLRVLIVEEGGWVSPDALVEVRTDSRGVRTVQPPRSDKAMVKLYKGAGINLAGDVGALVGSIGDVLDPDRRRAIKPIQTVSLVQPRVVGGGPHVNNAIHIPMREDTFQRWRDAFAGTLDYEALRTRMREVESDLGVNTVATTEGAGARSLRFAAGCQNAGIPVAPTPVSILPGGVTCGADNVVDPIGRKTGGLHPFRQNGPNSYLMRALHAPTPARVAHGMRAVRLTLNADGGNVQADTLLVEDRRGVPANDIGSSREIRAKKFVIAAGAVGSTNLLQRTAAEGGVEIPDLGRGLTANVGCPIYAVYDQPIVGNGFDDRPEPGVTQCFWVERERHPTPAGTVEDPALENWFFFPSTLTLALTGWFDHWAKIMNKYRHISACVMVVPTRVRDGNQVGADGRVRLEVDDEEFEMVLRGLEKMGRAFLAAATPDNGVTLYLPTKAILLDEDGAPLAIRTHAQLLEGIAAIRRRGAPFINLVTSHLQGGNAVGTTVDPATFRPMTADRGIIDNVYVADASIFPAGCEVNPQLTVCALAQLAADRVIRDIG